MESRLLFLANKECTFIRSFFTFNFKFLNFKILKFSYFKIRSIGHISKGYLHSEDSLVNRAIVLKDNLKAISTCSIHFQTVIFISYWLTQFHTFSRVFHVNILTIPRNGFEVCVRTCTLGMYKLKSTISDYF